MTAQSRFRVSNPPPKPLMIWDGDCHFCRRWIERWREITRDEVDYQISQKIGDRFSKIPREKFERSVIFLQAARPVYSRRATVFRSFTFPTFFHTSFSRV